MSQKAPVGAHTTLKGLDATGVADPLGAVITGKGTVGRLSRPAWKFEVAVPRLRPAWW